jgi:CRP/FNR family transcriptional regulator
MKGPYGFDPSEHCQTCQQKGESFFCQFSPAAVKDFDDIKSSAIYPAGALLFLEKQESRGVFVLCAGEAKMSINSSGGKTLILRIAKAGEVLGLMSTMTDARYEVTAETLRPSQVAYIRRADFLRFVARHPEVYQAVVRQLASVYKGACRQLRTVGLSSSAPEKLARLLLDWSDGDISKEHSASVKLPLTHEEIASLIGTTRETVTRTLSDFRSKRLVELRGSSLMISNRPALETIGAD